MIDLHIETGRLVCPNCGNQDPSDIVLFAETIETDCHSFDLVEVGGRCWLSARVFTPIPGSSRRLPSATVSHAVDAANRDHRSSARGQPNRALSQSLKCR